MSKDEKKYEVGMDQIDATLMESQAASHGITPEEFLRECIANGLRRRFESLRESISADEDRPGH